MEVLVWIIRLCVYFFIYLFIFFLDCRMKFYFDYVHDVMCIHRMYLLAGLAVCEFNKVC